MSNEDSMIIGAGGSWKSIDEKPDDAVVKQLTPLSCVAAVGEMLLRSRGIMVSQRSIIDIIDEPSSTAKLANYLNDVDTSKAVGKWYGSIIERKSIMLLLRKGPIGVVLRDGEPLGHLVFLPNAEAGRLTINDPWDGTSYKLSFFEFFRHWNGEVVFKWNL